MHVKTNIEHNIIHLIILSICPLMFLFVGAKEALYLSMLTIASFILSVSICMLFNKFLTREVKIFITGLISSLVVTVLNFIFQNYTKLQIGSSDYYYFAILSTIVLSTDIYYIDSKALVGNMFSKIILASTLFLGIFMYYAIIIEILGAGTLFGKHLFKGFSGIEFFKSVPFGFLHLGLICVVVQSIYRIVDKKIIEKKITYQKFVKKIRNEKVFQYDNLRRKKLLNSPITIKNINADEYEDIQDKLSVNENIVEEQKEDNEPENKKSNVSKKRKKLKVSKEAKVEQMFRKQTEDGEK